MDARIAKFDDSSLTAIVKPYTITTDPRTGKLLSNLAIPQQSPARVFYFVKGIAK